ncbi:Astacin (Peptidase family M12A) (plasmid) [Thermus oshimai JL-2]|uniref:Astacin (Peptidase family M12A) n=1 Tax=Thermus oshimai JL-2 TaxID=751945 RepID=K7R1Q9_THEOS|nr:M12 family metallopeptidase [Thermus oshimai]AFV77250.1 Astacin (Peptidase family M12A) [Thermus oshimai JL-2]
MRWTQVSLALGFLLAACSLQGIKAPPSVAWERVQVEFPDGTLGEVWGQVLPHDPEHLLVEGDILVPRPSSGLRPQGVSLEPQVLWGRLWPNGVVPYVLDESLTEAHRQVFQQAVAHIEAQTPVRFKPREGEVDYVRVFADGEPGTCYSSVGRMGGEQRLDVYCGREGIPPMGTVVHELLHALGFWHEQSRPDRDEWVEVRWENIVEQYAYNFHKYGYNARSHTPYDYASVMHYSAYAFSKNGQPTLVPKKADLSAIGQRNGLSPGDVEAIWVLYATPFLRLQSFVSYHASSRPSAYSFLRKLANTGAVALKVTQVEAEGFVEGVEGLALPLTLASGEEVDLFFRAAPCSTPGFEEARVRLWVEGRPDPYRASLIRACFTRWPEEKVVVQATSLGDGRVQLTYAEWGFATRYALEARVEGNLVEVSPSLLEVERQSALYTALVQVAPEGRGKEVCFTLTPLNSSLSEPAPGTACALVR